MLGEQMSLVFDAKNEDLILLQQDILTLLHDLLDRYSISLDNLNNIQICIKQVDKALLKDLSVEFDKEDIDKTKLEKSVIKNINYYPLDSDLLDEIKDITLDNDRVQNVWFYLDGKRLDFIDIVNKHNEITGKNSIFYSKDKFYFRADSNVRQKYLLVVKKSGKYNTKISF